MLKLKNGQYKDFTCLFVAYDELPKQKQNADVRENIKAAMIAAGLHGLTKKEERERMYAPQGNWKGVVDYIEKVN